jgi:SAM-dependent methyltransferase
MKSFTDQHYLRSEQYKTSANLGARNDLHARFSTNPYGWQHWVFDQLDLRDGERALELGCGPAYLWAANRERIPAGLNLTLTDFSPGMLEEARDKLGATVNPVDYRVVDAQSIPFEVAAFDVVIANHMLYHVPDRAGALSEIRRVLRPGGRFYATTVGRAHMGELRELVARFDPSIQFGSGAQTAGFSLETGTAQLTSLFASVDVRRYEDALEVTQVELLVAYVLSTAGDRINGNRQIALAQFVQAELAARDSIHIAKDSGIFVCRVKQ